VVQPRRANAKAGAERPIRATMGARRHLRPEAGFSLIELLVVMLILAILAALGLALFLGETEKAQDAEAKSLARNLQTHVEECFTETESWSACDSAAELSKAGLSWGTDPGEVQVLVRPFGRDVVAFAATSDTRTLFALVRGTDDRAMSRVCFVPANAYPTGACRRGGPFAGVGFGTW
jgi:prepilin-type N-terminal cleavage/methylation domain-containing protein